MDTNIQNYYILNTARNNAVADFICCGENIYLAHTLSGYGDKRGLANGLKLLLNTKGRKIRAKSIKKIIITRASPNVCNYPFVM